MDFYDLEKYRTGQNADGHDQFSIPLERDSEGMVGRECPIEACEPKYFKVDPQSGEKGKTDDAGDAADALTCPYCGTRSNNQALHTQEQIAWLKEMIFRDVAQAFADMLENTCRDSSVLEFKLGHLPSVRKYVEEKLRQTVTCDGCHCRYSVYGVSFHCPACGKGTVAQHLAQSSKTIKVLASEAERIGAEHGQQAQDRMYGNAYEDVVSLFEGFLKVLYRYAVKKRFLPADADRMLSKVKVNFQRLAGAEEFFERDLNVKLFDAIPAKERAVMESVFAKRHLLTHNLGLVDEKYREQVRTWERQGAEVPLKQGEILQALSSVEMIVRNASTDLGL